MKKYNIYLCVLQVLLLCGCTTTYNTRDKSLKDAFSDYFSIGVAVNNAQVSNRDKTGNVIIKNHFNSIVAENVMKCEKIHPEENRYFWHDADAFVKFGEQNDMEIIGHCLIWHSQCAPWFCRDKNGELVDKDTLRNHIRDHIYTIMKRYKGRIKGWDVVNEVLTDGGGFRNSDFYKILGEEYIVHAFRCAHEADPSAELYLNDYNMSTPAKRESYIRLIRRLKSQGITVDGVGMQSHMGLDYPDLHEYEKSIKSFAQAGCKVMISEWDMGAIPTVNTGADVNDKIAYQKELNPYPDDLPNDVSERWNARMDSVLQILIRNSNVISRVTVWGCNDGDSWKNDWPVPGRRDYPLLFDRNNNMKPFLVKYTRMK